MQPEALLLTASSMGIIRLTSADVSNRQSAYMIAFASPRRNALWRRPPHCAAVSTSQPGQEYKLSSVVLAYDLSTPRARSTFGCPKHTSSGFPNVLWLISCHIPSYNRVPMAGVQALTLAFGHSAMSTFFCPSLWQAMSICVVWLSVLLIVQSMLTCGLQHILGLILHVCMSCMIL